MNDQQPTNEFRLKSGSTLLNYLRHFSSTEKVVFGALALIALVTALIMAGQANGFFMAEIPAHGGELREGEIGLPRTVNPILAITDVDRDLSALVYAGLMRYDGGALVPDLAQSYSVSDDGLTYDFKLRPEARFQDGEPLTADDVAFTIQKIQDPALKSPRASDWANIAVKEISSTEIQFVLKQAYSPFLSNTTIGVMPKHIWGKVSDDQFIFSEYNIEPVGAGPYKPGPIKRNSGGIPTEYRLDAWNGYQGKQPFIDSIRFVFFPDQDKALAALDAGTIDSLPAISPAQAGKLAADTAEPYTILSSPLPRVFGVFFNQNQNILLADKSVRQALDLSIDRQTLVTTILNGYGSPLRGPLPAGIVTTANATDTADLVAAAAILGKAGWKKDPSTGVYGKKSGKSATTTLALTLYTSDTADLKKAADLVDADWTALGAQVTVKTFEPSDLYQNVILPRKYDALLFGEQIGKDRDLYAFWHSSQRNAPGLNVALYTNSKADKLLETIRSTNDDAARAAAYAQFDQIVRADTPAAFLYSPDFIYAVPKSLKGVALSAVVMPADRWSSVTDWYLNTEKVWKIFAHN